MKWEDVKHSVSSSMVDEMTNFLLYALILAVGLLGLVYIVYSRLIKISDDSYHKWLKAKEKRAEDIEQAEILSFKLREDKDNE